jgi:uroporphyrinogen III methyltransferase / synthase
MSDGSFSSKPLANRTILIACSPKKLAELASGIESMGGNALSLPVIEVHATDDMRPLDEALASLKKYAWIIFTSAYGVRYFFQRLRQTGIKLPPENMPRICAIGPATAREVHESGYSVELIPEKYVAEGLIEALEKYHGGLQALAGRRVLIPRAEAAREVLPEALTAAGIRVDAVPCYQTVRAEPDPEILQQLRNQKPDMLVFTSSSAIKSFIDILGKDAGVRMLQESAVAVLGPITGDTAASFGKSADIVPRENTIASLLEAIGEFYGSRR